MNNEDNTKKNEGLLIKLALAYESRGEKLHPAFTRLTNPVHRIDCVFNETSCKHYYKGKCKLTNKGSRRRFCPNEPPVRSYLPSVITYIPSAMHLLSQSEHSGLPPNTPQLAAPADTALGGRAFLNRIGRGYYCKVCKNYVGKTKNEVKQHMKTKKHKHNERFV